jgi:hypothetical protein
VCNTLPDTRNIKGHTEIKKRRMTNMAKKVQEKYTIVDEWMDFDDNRFLSLCHDTIGKCLRNQNYQVELFFSSRLAKNSFMASIAEYLYQSGTYSNLFTIYHAISGIDRICFTNGSMIEAICAYSSIRNKRFHYALVGDKVAKEFLHCVIQPLLRDYDDFS